MPISSCTSTVYSNFDLSFLPALCSRGTRDFLFGVLEFCCGQDAPSTGSLSPEAITGTYEIILTAGCAKLALGPGDVEVESMDRANGAFQNPIFAFSEILDCALKQGLAKEVEALLETTSSNFSSWRWQERQAYFTDAGIGAFIGRLLMPLQKHSVEPTPSIKVMVENLLRIISTKKSRAASQHFACSCSDCASLAVFLWNCPLSQKVFNKLSPTRLTHIVGKLVTFGDALELGIRCRTTLHVTKRHASVFLMSKMLPDTDPKTVLKGLEGEYLRAMLGEDLYEELVLLNSGHLQRATITQAIPLAFPGQTTTAHQIQMPPEISTSLNPVLVRTAPGSIAQNDSQVRPPRPSLAGTKRKADSPVAIDLTSD
jgi:hypothetical protein